MMDIKELFSGIAIIIDDKINDDESGDKILQIRKKLKSEQIPFIEYEDIPSNEIIGNFSNVSFVLLDWELFDKPEPGMKIDEEIFIKNNIDFIKNIKETTFVPIFIFSYLDPDAIVRKLSEEGLYNDDSNNFIFVKKKDDLISKDDENKIFTEIEKWLNKTPSIYVLKEWEKALSKSKKELFWSFYDTNHYWPSVLQKSFIGDGSDVNYELGSFIFKNIMARTEPIKFDETILKLEDDKIDTEDIRKILEAERFIKKNSLSPNIPFSGDLFELPDYEINKNSKKTKKSYYLNIRPACDTIRDKDSKKGSTIKSNEVKFNPKLYCLKCEIVKDKDFEIKNGAITERINNAYIPFVFEGKTMKINFDSLSIFRWKEKLLDKDDNETDNIFKDRRIGRILSPYITKVQQKYSYYLQRQGLPAIPEKAIIDE
jgi:hypothetical protein